MNRLVLHNKYLSKLVEHNYTEEYFISTSF